MKRVRVPHAVRIPYIQKDGQELEKDYSFGEWIKEAVKLSPKAFGQGIENVEAGIRIRDAGSKASPGDDLLFENADYSKVVQAANEVVWRVDVAQAAISFFYALRDAKDHDPNEEKD